MADEQVPVALDAESVGTGITPIPDLEASTPAATDATLSKEARDRLARQGRELAETKRVLASQAATISRLEEQLNTVNATMTAQQERQMEAHLASLPEDERMAARIDLLEKQLKQSRTAGPPQPAQTAQMPTQDQITQQAQAILKKVGTKFGVELSVDNPNLDWDNPTAFYESAVELAATAKHAPAAKKDDAAVPAQTNGEGQRRASSPAAPRPQAPRRNGSVSTDDFRAVTDSYKSKLGPKQQAKQLRELRDKVVQQHGQAAQ